MKLIEIAKKFVGKRTKEEKYRNALAPIGSLSNEKIESSQHSDPRKIPYWQLKIVKKVRRQMHYRLGRTNGSASLVFFYY